MNETLEILRKWEKDKLTGEGHDVIPMIVIIVILISPLIAIFVIYAYKSSKVNTDDIPGQV